MTKAPGFCRPFWLFCGLGLTLSLGLSGCRSQGRAELAASASADVQVEAKLKASASAQATARLDASEHVSGAVDGTRVEDPSAPQLPIRKHQTDGANTLATTARAHSFFRVVREAVGYKGNVVRFGRALNVALGIHDHRVFMTTPVDIEWQAPVPKKFSHVGLYGNFPDAAFLSGESPYHGHQYFRFDPAQKIWKQVAKNRGLMGVAYWKKGSLLGLERTGLRYLHRPKDVGYRFAVLEGHGAVPRAPRVRGRAVCTYAADVLAFHAIPSGEIFVVVQDCSHPLPPYELSIQRWTSSGERFIERPVGLDQVESYGVQDLMAADITGTSASNVYVVVSAVDPDTLLPVPFLVHWEGSQWKRIEVPTDLPLVGVSVDPEGLVWIAAYSTTARCPASSGDGSFDCTRGQLLKFDPKTGKYQELKLPMLNDRNGDEELHPYAVRAYDSGVWAAAKTGRSQRHVLLFSR